MLSFDPVWTCEPGNVQSPFVDWTWEIFLLPHDLNMSSADLDRLRSAASAVGDRDAFISGESYARMSSLLIDFELTSFDEAYSQLICIADSPHVFGRSACWGMLCTHSDYSLLGGVAEVMDRYAAQLGGRSGVRQNFFERFSLMTSILIGRAGFGSGLLRLAGWEP
jgi:hypothetical protein